MKKNLTIVIMILLILASLQVGSTGNEPTSYNFSSIHLVDNDAVDDPENNTWNTISKALTHAVSGDIIKVYNGTYHEILVIDKDVTILGQDTDLFGDDTDGVLVDGGGQGDVVTITSYGVTINGITVQNSGLNDAGFHILSYSTVIEQCTSVRNCFGILCSNTHTVVLSDNQIRENNLAGIKLDACPEYIRISRNTISSNAAGIICEESSNVVINQNQLVGNSGPAIELKKLSKQNSITTNHMENNTMGIYLWWNSNDNIITGNTILNNSNAGIHANLETSVQPSDLYIANNELRNNSEYGLYFFRVRDADIVGNQISGAKNGIYVESSNYSTFQSNHLSYNQIGIHHIRSLGNVFTNNDIESNMGGCLFSFSRNTRLLDNLFQNNSYGITLKNAKQNTIRSNMICENIDGLLLSTQSHENTITNNHITHNSQYGIKCDFAKNNIIRENTIENNNHTGIHLQYISNDNLIIHNNFINNTLHAFDSCENIWSDCDATGGNYWDDYEGYDATNDGLGNIPYNISGGTNQDACPFMVRDGWDFLSNLFGSGTLTWARIRPGSTVSGSFTIANNGASGSYLDWMITSYPDWGTWTFEPESGTSLTPEQGPINVQVTVQVPNEKKSYYNYHVTITNLHNEANYHNIPVSLSMPLSKENRINYLWDLIHFFFPFLNHLYTIY